MIKEELDFLRESNNIENVWDDLSLQQAILAWQYLISEQALSQKNILEAHKILMLYQPIKDTEKGSFRKVDVWVGSNPKPRWQSVSYLFKEWLDRLETIKDFKYSKKDKKTLSQSLHVQFEDCHPFIDGNGRIGRIVMNWLRIKWFKLPILVIQESKKQEYYKWFKQ